jgi:Tat protein translocase TatB subunit
MFGLSFMEIAVVLVVALLVLGPEKLPKVARQLGKGVRELRRAATDFQRTLNGELSTFDDDVTGKGGIRSELGEIGRSLREAGNPTELYGPQPETPASKDERATLADAGNSPSSTDKPTPGGSS